MGKTAFAPYESDEQRALFEWAARSVGRYPALRLMYAVPNGGSRNPIEARHLKQQGVKPGVPDICLPVPSHHYTALYIELKRRHGGRVSAEQREWLHELGRVGNLAVVARGAEEAITIIKEYLRQ